MIAFEDEVDDIEQNYVSYFIILQNKVNFISCGYGSGTSYYL